jgi:hypothetical protein
MRRLSSRTHLAFGVAVAICACWMIATSSAFYQDSGKTLKSNSEVEHCRRIKDERARMHCYQEESSKASPSVTASGTWQLVRTPNPAGGPDSISITKMVNRSDHDIAGLMLRCAEGATTEVLVVLIEPLQLRTHPKVTVAAGARTTEFTASVVTPGALVLLPEKASALVENAWQSVPELAVTIAENHRSLHGVIPLANINTAMQALQSNCQRRGG